jgi:hypothetical protein
MVGLVLSDVVVGGAASAKGLDHSLEPGADPEAPSGGLLCLQNAPRPSGGVFEVADEVPDLFNRSVARTLWVIVAICPFSDGG